VIREAHLGKHAIRLAVQDASTNNRMVRIIAKVVGR
jgi:hypothetical protein